jgi:uncharacterized membrane protein (DUF485 family)
MTSAIWRGIVRPFRVSREATPRPHVDLPSSTVCGAGGASVIATGCALADEDATGRSTIGASSRGGGGDELHAAMKRRMAQRRTTFFVAKARAKASILRDAMSDSDRDRALESLAARRLRVALALTSVMLLTYFGFLLLIAYDKPALAALVTPGLSVGILLGALVIVVAWVVTGIYVRWANRVYDVEVAKLRTVEKKE